MRGYYSTCVEGLHRRLPGRPRGHRFQKIGGVVKTRNKEDTSETRIEKRKEDPPMNDTRSGQAKASASLVQQVETYVQRCLQGIEAQEERRGAGPDPKGPGRPLELPKVALWSSLLLCVLQGARGVLEVWRDVVLHGYDVCDQTLYDRFEQEGTAWLEQFFAQIGAMLAAWLRPLLTQQAWYPLASFATDVLALDETTLDPVARKLPILRLLKKGAAELLPGKLAGLYDVRLQLWRRGRQLGLLRPCSRTRVQGPVVAAEQIQPRPADLVLTRPAKYPHDPGQAGRKGQKRRQDACGPPEWGPAGLTAAGYACLGC